MVPASTLILLRRRTRPDGLLWLIIIVVYFGSVVRGVASLVCVALIRGPDFSVQRSHHESARNVSVACIVYRLTCSASWISRAIPESSAYIQRSHVGQALFLEVASDGEERDWFRGHVDEVEEGHDDARLACPTEKPLPPPGRGKGS